MRFRLLHEPDDLPVRRLITGELSFGLGTVAAIVVLAGVLYLLLRRNKYGEYGERLTEKKAAVNV